MGQKLDRLVSLKRCNEPLDEQTLKWVKGLPPELALRLAGIGRISGLNLHQHMPLAQHLDDFERFVKGRGSKPHSVRQKVGRIRRVFEGCGFKFYRDIVRSGVVAFLADFKTKRKELISPMRPESESTRKEGLSVSKTRRDSSSVKVSSFMSFRLLK